MSLCVNVFVELSDVCVRVCGRALPPFLDTCAVVSTPVWVPTARADTFKVVLGQVNLELTSSPRIAYISLCRVQ